MSIQLSKNKRKISNAAQQQQTPVNAVQTQHVPVQQVQNQIPLAQPSYYNQGYANQYQVPYANNIQQRSLPFGFQRHSLNGGCVYNQMPCAQAQYPIQQFQAQQVPQQHVQGKSRLSGSSKNQVRKQSYETKNVQYVAPQQNYGNLQYAQQSVYGNQLQFAPSQAYPRQFPVQGYQQAPLINQFQGYTQYQAPVQVANQLPVNLQSYANQQQVVYQGQNPYLSGFIGQQNQVAFQPYTRQLASPQNFQRFEQIKQQQFERQNVENVAKARALDLYNDDQYEDIEQNEEDLQENLESYGENRYKVE